MTKEARCLLIAVSEVRLGYDSESRRGLVFGSLVIAFCLLGRAAAVCVSEGGTHHRISVDQGDEGKVVAYRQRDHFGSAKVLPLALVTNSCKA